MGAIPVIGSALGGAGKGAATGATGVGASTAASTGAMGALEGGPMWSQIAPVMGEGGMVAGPAPGGDAIGGRMMSAVTDTGGPVKAGEGGGFSLPQAPPSSGKSSKEPDPWAKLMAVTGPMIQQMQANQALDGEQGEEMKLFKQRQKVVEMEFQRDQRLKKFKAMMGGQ